jgi:hypothetical protein
MNYQGKKMKDWKDHECNCAETNKKAGKDIYSCFLCEKPRKELSYYEKFQNTLAYAERKSKGMVDGNILYREIFEKFITENIKVAVEKTKIPFRGRIK